MPPIGYSQNFFQRIRDLWTKDISFVDKETDIFIFSWVFAHALNELTESFRLLDELEKRDYEPAKEFQISFGEALINVMKDMGIPVYPLTKKLNQKCKVIFSNNFSSKK